MRIGEILSLAPVIPVLMVDNEDDAAPLVRALVEGGLKAIEITLRTGAALGAIRRASAEVPESVIGAGTVLDADDLTRAHEAGARFAVSPGATPELLDAALHRGPLLLPGAATASELMELTARGYCHAKFFPAEAAGGAGALKAFSGPFPRMRFCPTGGVGPENAPAYLALSNVLCVGGSWVAPEDVVKARDWPRITALARQAAALGKEAAPGAAGGKDTSEPVARTN